MTERQEPKYRVDIVEIYESERGYTFHNYFETDADIEAIKQALSMLQIKDYIISLKKGTLSEDRVFQTEIITKIDLKTYADTQAHDADMQDRADEYNAHGDSFGEIKMSEEEPGKVYSCIFKKRDPEKRAQYMRSWSHDRLQFATVKAMLVVSGSREISWSYEVYLTRSGAVRVKAFKWDHQSFEKVPDGVIKQFILNVKKRADEIHAQYHVNVF